MTNQRLGLICKILAQNRMRGVKLNGKSAFEKELNDWVNRPTIKINENSLCRSYSPFDDTLEYHQSFA